MPRYFQSLGAGRPIQLGDRSFVFEPIEPMGGSWAGVLAVDDESAANILAGAGLEITEARYNELKKKVTDQMGRGSVPSRTPPQLPPQPLVASANRAEVRTDSNSESTTPAAVAPATASVELATTTKQPPFEPLLEVVTTSTRRKAA